MEVLAYLSANRDENVFEDPFRFDVVRPDNKQVAFGYGVHFCLGAHLARLELRVFFEELLARVDDLGSRVSRRGRRRCSSAA